ncbi:MAG: ATP-binding cassette domain-containing protein [Myxococcales bacterium]|nr:ATP-binding cassette domain-containing protein [Myxococcales bacterium]
MIRVEDLSLGFQERVLLKEVDFEIPSKGILALMGPSGTGKSTLLRTLGRWNELHPAFWCHGRIELDGEDLSALPLEESWRRVALLAQKARLYTSSIMDNAIAEVRGDRSLSVVDKRALAQEVLEPLGLWQELRTRLDESVVDLSIARQRMLALARLCSGGARCLLADEPFRDIDEAELGDLREMLVRLAEERPVVLVTHNQAIAREISDHVCLFTARRLVESGPTDRFFSEPQTDLGRTFVGSGNCWPSVPSEPPPPGSMPTWKPTPQEAAPRPGGFHWVIRDRLGGMQWPGLLTEGDDDLAGLRALGVRKLVSLTEVAFDPERLLPYGIKGEHFPIVDMDVPAVADAHALCGRVAAAIDGGHPVVFHCKAGLGRTGTLLACMLVFRGETAVRAVHRVRSVNTLYIQSQRQLEFVSEFEIFCKAWNT